MLTTVCKLCINAYSYLYTCIRLQNKLSQGQTWANALNGEVEKEAGASVKFYGQGTYLWSDNCDSDVMHSLTAIRKSSDAKATGTDPSCGSADFPMILLRSANVINFDLGLKGDAGGSGGGGGGVPLTGAHIFLVGRVEVDAMDPASLAVWFRSDNNWVNVGSYAISDAFSLSDASGWHQGTRLSITKFLHSTRLVKPNTI